MVFTDVDEGPNLNSQSSLVLDLEFQDSRRSWPRQLLSYGTRQRHTTLPGGFSTACSGRNVPDDSLRPANLRSRERSVASQRLQRSPNKKQCSVTFAHDFQKPKICYYSSKVSSPHWCPHNVGEPVVGVPLHLVVLRFKPLNVFLPKRPSPIGEFFVGEQTNVPSNSKLVARRRFESASGQLFRRLKVLILLTLRSPRQPRACRRYRAQGPGAIKSNESKAIFFSTMSLFYCSRCYQVDTVHP